VLERHKSEKLNMQLVHFWVTQLNECILKSPRQGEFSSFYFESCRIRFSSGTALPPTKSIAVQCSIVNAPCESRSRLDVFVVGPVKLAFD